MKASVIIAAMARTFSDDEYLYLDLRRIAGKVAMMETVLGDVVGESECTGNVFDYGGCIDEDEGAGPCLWCRAKAALE